MSLSWYKIGIPILATCIYTILELLVRATGQEKETKNIQVRKEEIILPHFQMP
jgi:hypothetical protein